MRGRSIAASSGIKCCWDWFLIELDANLYSIYEPVGVSSGERRLPLGARRGRMIVTASRSSSRFSEPFQRDSSVMPNSPLSARLSLSLLVSLGRGQFSSQLAALIYAYMRAFYSQPRPMNKRVDFALVGHDYPARRCYLKEIVLYSVSWPHSSLSTSAKPVLPAPRHRELGIMRERYDSSGTSSFDERRDRSRVRVENEEM
ncbi:hypothetical protein D9619_013722 [Psilocybe cf. subviscida]|uniref:Uncharacterized protein n=1 Tax=Psilocybe cf. subviscida TaxID=2480587 RepID=A0A8H5AZE2_9AGAR|nr:hypothetical protein D9619_013722 [Psilocybe cf. subviscida]